MKKTGTIAALLLTLVITTLLGSSTAHALRPIEKVKMPAGSEVHAVIGGVIESFDRRHGDPRGGWISIEVQKGQFEIVMHAQLDFDVEVGAMVTPETVIGTALPRRPGSSKGFVKRVALVDDGSDPKDEPRYVALASLAARPLNALERAEAMPATTDQRATASDAPTAIQIDEAPTAPTAEPTPVRNPDQDAVAVADSSGTIAIDCGLQDYRCVAKAFAELVKSGAINTRHPLALTWSETAQQWEVQLAWKDSRQFGADRPGNRPNECVDGHCGVDIGEIIGEIVMAALDGQVVKVVAHSDGNGGGKRVWIRYDFASGHHILFGYMHLATTKVVESQWVHAGDIVGTLGDTAGSDTHTTSPHLHFTVCASKGSGSECRYYLDPEEMLVKSTTFTAEAIAAMPARLPRIQDHFPDLEGRYAETWIREQIVRHSAEIEAAQRSLARLAAESTPAETVGQTDPTAVPTYTLGSARLKGRVSEVMFIDHPTNR